MNTHVYIITNEWNQHDELTTTEITIKMDIKMSQLQAEWQML